MTPAAARTPLDLDVVDSTLASFVREMTAATCERLELRHVSSDGADHHVRAWSLAGTDDSPQAIASRIFSVASGEAGVMRGVQTYAICAYRPGSSSYDARQMFRVAGDATDDALGQTERPTIAGVLALQMRHNEANQRLAINSSLDIVRRYERLLENRDAYILKLEQKHLQVLELYEGLQSTKGQRDLETRREDRKDANAARVIAQLEKFLPKLGELVFGGDGGSELADLRKIVTTISNEQLGQMLAPLNPEQQAAMMKAINAIFESEVAKADAAKKASANGAPVNGAPS